MENIDRNNGRDTAGRFIKGNSGRPKGSRNKVSVALENLLEGEAEEITRVAIEKAKAGDNIAIKLILDRVFPRPRERSVSVEVSDIQTSRDTAPVMYEILQSVTSGAITPDEALRLTRVVETLRRCLEIEDLERRLEALEA